MKKIYSLSFLFLIFIMSMNLKAQDVQFNVDVDYGCAPLTVTFTNISTVGTTYEWYINNSTQPFYASDTTITFEYGNEYYVDINAFDEYGSYQGTYSHVITVEGPNFNISTGETACPGEKVYFDVNANLDWVEWDFGYGPVHEDDWKVSKVFNNPGSYDITLYGIGPCGYDSITKTLIVTGSAVPNFNIYVQGDSENCIGDEIYFSCTNEIHSYLWNFDDGSTSTFRNPHHAFFGYGSKIVTMTGTNLCGNSAVDTINIWITNEAVASSEFYYWPENACPGEIIGFETNGFGEYDWDFGDDGSAYVNSPQYMYGDTGTYDVTLIVTNGCGDSDTTTQQVVVQADPMNKPEAVIYFASGDNWDTDTLTICPGEEITIKNYAWDESNLIFEWDMADGTSYTERDVAHVYQNTGFYEVSMIATNNCLGKDTATLWVNVDASAMPSSYLQAIPLVICPGENLYFFDEESYDNNNSSYMYSMWFGDGDSLMNQTTFEDSLTQTFHHAYPNTGTYNFIFTVTNSCGNTVSYNDILTVQTDPAEEAFYYYDNSTTSGGGSYEDNNMVCPDDEVTFMVVGGMSYQWHFGDGGTSTDQFATHAYADTGIYEAYCIATNGCGRIDTLYTEAAVSDTAYPDPWFDMDEDNVCAFDSIKFEYSDDDEATYNYTFLWDFDDGNFSTERNPEHAFEEGGDFFVKLVVSNSCGSDSIFRHIFVANPRVKFSADQQEIQPGEQVSFSNETIGGTSFMWDFGDGTTSSQMNPSHIYNDYGVYDVTLTATNPLGCTTVKTSESFIFVHNMQIVQATIYDTRCWGDANGAIDLIITGGTPPYNYQWSDGGTTQDRNNLAPGFYEITITDNNGVFLTQSYTVNQPNPISVDVYIEPELCGNDGYVELEIYGGTPPFQVMYSNEDTGLVLDDLAAGDYYGLIIDANGCTFGSSFNIAPNSNPMVINIPDLLTDATCNVDDGVAWVEVTGGSGSFSYYWDDDLEQTTDTAWDLYAGVYSVWVEDNVTDCWDSAIAVIQNVGGPTINSITGYPPTCLGATDGYIGLDAWGSQPLSFEWSTEPPQYSQDASDVQAGYYTVTITDPAGCQATGFIELDDYNMPYVEFDYQNPSCAGAYDGYAIAELINIDTIREYDFFWSNGSWDSIIQNRNAGIYYVTVSDNWGCSFVDNITLVDPPAIELTVYTSDVTFYGQSNGVIDLTITNGVPPFDYYWSNGATTQDLYNISAGSYTGTIIDANGCSITGTEVISEPAMLDVTITANGPTTFCSGESVVLSADTGFNSYYWSTGETTQSITASATGHYWVAASNSVSYGVDSIFVNSVEPYSGEGICLVTVDYTNGKNLIVWEKTPDVGIVSYNIYKESNSAGVYNLIGNVQFDDESIFTDTSSIPEQQSDRYAISVIDTCGNESPLSSEHKTMHLTVSTGVGVYNLIWENYEGFTFGSYVIYRGTTPYNLAPIGTIQSNLTSYSDYQPQGLFYYQIAVIKDDTCLLDNTGLKAQGGPYSQSFSNLDDNGIQVDDLVADFSASYTSVYINNSINFYSQSTGTPTVFEWTFEGGTPATYSGESPPLIFYDSIGVFDVSLTIMDDSDTSTMVKSDYITVEYNSNLNVQFMASPRYFTEPPFNVAFDNQTPNGEAYSYVWNFGDGNLSSEFQPFHTYQDTGLYTVTLIATDTTNGITDTSTQIDYIYCTNGTGIDEIFGSNGDLNIYPNPFYNYTTIEFVNPNREQYSLRVIDITGKLIRQIDGINEEKIILEREGINSGIYIIELKGEKLYRSRVVLK